MNVSFLTSLATALIGESTYVVEREEPDGLGSARWDEETRMRVIVLDPSFNRPDSDLLGGFLHEVAHHRLGHVVRDSAEERARARARYEFDHGEIPNQERKLAALTAFQEAEANLWVERTRPLVDAEMVSPHNRAASFDEYARADRTG